VALDQAEVKERLDPGCEPRIVRVRHSFVIILEGPAPSGVVCARDHHEEFPSRKHADDWLAKLRSVARKR
jgi:hypothetical protein